MAARFEIRTAKFGRWSDVQRRTLPTGNMPTRGDIHVSWGQVNTDEFQHLLEENEGSWLMEKQTNGKRPAQKSYCSWIAKDFPQEGTRDSGFFGLSFHVEPNHVQADASGAVFNKVVARCFLCEKFSTNALVRCARGNTMLPRDRPPGWREPVGVGKGWFSKQGLAAHFEGHTGHKEALRLWREQVQVAESSVSNMATGPVLSPLESSFVRSRATTAEPKAIAGLNDHDLKSLSHVVKNVMFTAFHGDPTSRVEDLCKKDRANGLAMPVSTYDCSTRCGQPIYKSDAKGAKEIMHFVACEVDAAWRSQVSDRCHVSRCGAAPLLIARCLAASLPRACVGTARRRLAPGMGCGWLDG